MNSAHNREDDEPTPLEGMIGAGDAMRDVYRMTRKVAASSATVLLLGETGTGKELIAKALHTHSQRSTGPYVRVNCGALAESLLESELFGHTKGAFTSAVENRTGRFEAAHGGTIFLDEINSISLPLQVKLLRVLQEGEFERVGDTKTISVDCRIIAATNRDLEDEIAAGRFREDLYYRLNVVPIYVPALRDRAEDIPDLVNHFSDRYAGENGRRFEIDRGVLPILQTYDWPGNVRELENYIERAIVLSTDGKITADLLPPHVRGLSPPRIGKPTATDKQLGREQADALAKGLVTRVVSDAGSDASALYDNVVSLMERELIRHVLTHCQGVQTKAAARLGINRNTLHKKIEDYNLSDLVR